MNASVSVSAIVPARNEEQTIARAVRSLARQPEIGEILVVNDKSTDGTAAELSRLAGETPSLRVLETRELPQGWVGKNYAVSLGAAEARGEWLLFTDADAEHLPGSTAAALADAAATGAALISYSPEQETLTWWERAMIPFVYVRLGQLFPFDAVNDPDSPAAAANGQYLLIRRDAYDRIGGHAAVAGELLEDIALARLAKRAGVHIHFTRGSGRVRVRMYRSFRAMWQGWTKNLYPLVGGTGWAATRELLQVVPWIPLGLILLTPVRAWLGVLGLVLLAGRFAAYAAALRRNRFPVVYGLYYLPGIAIYVAALSASEWHYMRGTIQWKGREYSVGERK
ncbi:MAG TPA: glycosyltransferase family 2 protein [Methylomirabilota bacterium]|nr:glycosyltransferase family 2 protein [Methylomirabilota bacterium]